jgi:hypothetical protein
MGLRQITGYIAHLLLGVYWLWVISRTAPQLRRGVRDRMVRLRVALIKTAALAVTALVVGVIHFWATEWWHVVLAVLCAIVLGLVLHRSYRSLRPHRATGSLWCSAPAAPNASGACTPAVSRAPTNRATDGDGLVAGTWHLGPPRPANGTQPPP